MSGGVSSIAIKSEIPGGAMPAEAFDWSQGDRVATLRQLYLVELKSAGEIADVLGCRVRSVIRKVQRLELAKLRPAGTRLAELRRDAAKGSARAAGLRRLELARREQVRAVVSVADADLIALAVAAGKVTVVPPGCAAGISAWERATGYIAPPPSFDYGGRRFGAAETANRAARVSCAAS